MQLALFDLDNTLLNGDSDYQWGQFLIEQGVLNATHTSINEQFYQDYKDGNLDIVAFLEFQFQPLMEHPRAQLDIWHQAYMQHKVRPMMTQKSRDLVEQHRKNGDLLVVITATNSFVTAPIAAEFGIENLIATEPEAINGEFTGHVSGIPSFKEGKVTRLNQWLQARGESLSSFETTWFYSDSHNDLPLMQVVNKPVAVNADPILADYAKANGWPTMSLR
ncbi:MAG: HAD family hydrolase [Methylophilaceae bacterium]